MGKGLRRKFADDDPRQGMCPTHDPKFEWFPDYRIERGEQQKQCAVCRRWLWPDEQGPNFMATSALDTD